MRVKITDEILQQYKQKYPEVYEKVKFCPKEWENWVKAMEMQKQIRKEVKKELNKRREKALLILATEIIKDYPDFVERLLKEKRINLIVKRGNREVDYTPIILQEIERVKKERQKEIIAFVCECGELVSEEVIALDYYGISITKCRNCGKRYKIEVDGKDKVIKRLSQRSSV